MMPVLEQALGEWRVFLTCTALEPETHPMAVDGWAQTVERTSAFLSAQGFSATIVPPFTARARPEALMLPGDTPFAQVRAFCNAHPGWRRQLDTFDFTMLPGALEEALAE